MALQEHGYAATLESIAQAADRIRQHAHVTPVLTCSSLDELSGRKLFFKCEVFQKGGAFKFRGACNAVSALSEEDASKGVVTHSSGNHAGAVALAAKIRNIKSFIVVPHTTPKCKIDAIKAYGGEVFLCEPTIDAREAQCQQVQQDTGATFIHPYNNSLVISGQGTIGLEFVQQIEQLDAIVVPVSGGGMISGIATAAKALRPGIKIIAAEPLGRNQCADVAQAKAAGAIVQCPKTDTIADGLQGRLGDLTWPIVRDFVEEVVTVSEEEIVSAMRLVFERMKVVVEPSAAVGLAAVLSTQFASSTVCNNCSRVGIILCGGNVDMTNFWNTFK